MKYIAILLTFIVSTKTYAQTINFTDSELKQYLISEACANTNVYPTSSGQFDVDTNDDNEIQLSEALSIKYLYLSSEFDNYSIQSLDDLVNFSNLVTLNLRLPINFDQIQLDSLKNFYVIDVGGITKIDISNLPNLSDTIRIEGIGTLDTLNIRNGSSAKSFSLFYTQNIKYACVDSIANEYNAFGTFGAMDPDGTLSTSCSALMTSVDEIPQDDEITLFPNPTNGKIEINLPEKIDELLVINSIGEVISQKQQVNNSLDISSLSQGIYFLKITVGEKYFIKKLIKK